MKTTVPNPFDHVFTYMLLTILTLSTCSQPGTESDESEKVLPYIRYNADSKGGVKALTAMSVALKEMKKLPCKNPVSWYYQGAIHWVPDTVLNGNPFCPIYQSVKDTLKAWNNCTHISGDANSDYQFLIWHRLYIWHFEKVIRKFSKDKKFALPFWRYVDPRYRKMPGELRKKTSSLYNSERLDSLNNGQDISKAFALELLDSATLTANESRTYSVFNSHIDEAPHGAMHDYIGGGWSNTPMFNSIYQAGPYTPTDTLFGWMTHVPSAGFDPVFWLHHANIDFLWNEWENSPNGERPSFQQVADHPWHFVFPNPDGTFVTYTMREAYERAFNPDYIYDGASPLISLETEAHDNLIKDAQLTVPKDSLINEAFPGKAIGSGMTKLALEGELKSTFNQVSSASTLLKQNGDKKEFIIEIEVSFKREPKGGFVVYLDDEGETDGDQGLFLGVMSFFGAAHHASSHKGHKEQSLRKTFLFDASDEVLNAGETPHLIFKRTGGGNVGIVVERISVYLY